MTGDPTLADRIRWWATWHVPLVRRLRCWHHDRHARPGFRPTPR